MIDRLSVFAVNRHFQSSDPNMGVIQMCIIVPIVIAVIVGTLLANIHFMHDTCEPVLRSHSDLIKLARKRVLLISTSHATLGVTGSPTGVYLEELSSPYYVFKEAGMSVDVVSIKGGPVPIDPASLTPFLMADSERRFVNDGELQHLLNNTQMVEDVDFTAYDAVFAAGGWGAAFDLAQSAELGVAMSAAYQADKIIGSVCHGSLALANMYSKDGTHALKGKTVTGVTNLQIYELGVAFFTEKHPENVLKEIGANYESKHYFLDFFTGHTVRDGKIITGQNQKTSCETAEWILDALLE